MNQTALFMKSSSQTSVPLLNYKLLDKREDSLYVICHVVKIGLLFLFFQQVLTGSLESILAQKREDKREDIQCNSHVFFHIRKAIKVLL